MAITAINTGYVVQDAEGYNMDDEGYSMDDANIVDVIHTEDYGDIEIGSWEDFEDGTVICDVDC